MRAFISRIVEEINKLLADDIRRAVTAAVDRRRHSPIPSAAALDYKDTIRRNLKNYNPELKRLVPEHFYFYDRTTSNAANKYCLLYTSSDRYAEIADAAEKFLSGKDGQIVPLAKRGFWETTDNGRIHRLRVIESICGGAENEFYLGLLKRAKKELRAEAIHADVYKRQPYSQVHPLEQALTESGGGRLVPITEAVSYTHLDVYKRQPQGWSPTLPWQL